MRPPSLDVDLFATAIRREPYAAFAAVRDCAPICRLAALDLHAVGRHAVVKAVLGDWQTFSSAQGVALNDTMNGWMIGTALTTDPPQHDGVRRLLGRPLAPARLAALRPRLRELADARVAELVGQGPFDAVPALARLLPLAVVSELVGLPPEGREQMLDWAAAAFNGMAPANVPLCRDAFAVMGGMVSYITDPTLPERLVPGSWAAELWSGVESGEITAAEFQSLLQGYVSPSLDTTIFAATNLMWLLARHQDQWAMLKDDPSLVPRCINESLRIESPALGFSRVATRDVEIEGYEIGAGTRIMTLAACANRDERRYAAPDRFDVTRDASDHLAFGGGVHRCVGGNLAMLELTSLLEALVRHVGRIELVEAERADSAMLRGFSRLVITLEPGRS